MFTPVKRSVSAFAGCVFATDPPATNAIRRVSVVKRTID
jgi:hypothetical protein